MIKLESLDPEQSAPEYYLSSPLAVDGNKVPVALSPLVNELGKNLLKAAAVGDIEEIRKLLIKGAPFTADWLGTSPLHLAAQGNHAEICELLLSAGISPNARTKVDRTPLHMAACEGHMDIVELLLVADADVDCTDLLGMTPLHWAVQNGHSEIVFLLLKSNARVDIANKFSLKPGDVAGQINRPDIVRMLEEHSELQQQEDPTIAAKNLTIEMAAQDEERGSPLTKENFQTCSPSSQVSEDMLPDDEEDTGGVSDHDITLDLTDPQQAENSVSMKILQEHGITMLPNDDDNNILSTVMETGHSVVLTDIGKQVLDCVKASEEAAQTSSEKILKANNNYITVTAEELLLLASNGSINKNPTQIYRKVNGKYVPKTVKKVVMTKDKLQPITPAPNHLLRQNATFLPTQTAPSASNVRSTPLLSTNRPQVALLTKQLEEAKQTIEEYKQKLLQKEAEAEGYKQQLRLLGYS